MLKLRIKLDTWTSGIDEDIREKAREELLALYCQLPTHRMWLYLKRVRFMFRGGTRIGMWNEIEDSTLSVEDLHGPEDVIAICKIYLTHSRFILLAKERSADEFCR